MTRARDLAGDGDQLGEGEMLAVLRPNAEAEPRRAAVAHDLPTLGRLFEECERRTKPVAKLRAVHTEELLLRVVEVIHVDGLKPQVGAALRELVRQERGR